MQVFGKVTLILFVSVFLGCATAPGATIITGETRPAISPHEVIIYLEPPYQYEVIGLLEASSESNSRRQRQAAVDRAINDLKERAAQIGANGILIVNMTTERTGGGPAFGFGSSAGRHTDVFVGVGGSAERVVIQARAIFVYPLMETNSSLNYCLRRV